SSNKNVNRVLAANAFAAPEFQRGHQHEYSCVLLSMDSEKERIAAWAEENLSAGVLAEKGVEDKPHVTVRYGLHTNDAKEVSDAFTQWSQKQREANPEQGAPE